MTCLRSATCCLLHKQPASASKFIYINVRIHVLHGGGGYDRLKRIYTCVCVCLSRTDEKNMVVSNRKKENHTLCLLDMSCTVFLKSLKLVPLLDTIGRHNRGHQAVTACQRKHCRDASLLLHTAEFEQY